MKKKILISSLITLMFALITITSSFFYLINIQEINNKKEILSIYNNIVIKILDKDKELLNDFISENDNIRFTFVNSQGESIMDTRKRTNEDYLVKNEIISAFKFGEGSDIRVSYAEGRETLYYATKLNENLVVRSSVSMEGIKGLTRNYLKYYILIIFIVIILSVIVSKRLIKSIIKPIKEMENTTNKIADGDYSQRVKIYTNDEIGSLARTFNEMSDLLQHKIIDSVDQKHKLEAILESMESGVIALDAKLNIMLINQYAKSVFEINNVVIGENISQYILDYDINEFIKNEETIKQEEIKIIYPIEKDIRIKKSPIINYRNVPIGTVITLQDITDIKRLENIRSQFVANVSHELKTPLTSIKGFSETLRFVNDNDTKNKFLDIIDKEAERLTNLINDILILSNIENSYKMKEEKFNTSMIIEDAIDTVTPQMLKKNIIVNFIDEGSKFLIGDSDKFYQMILNLLENAIKYSEPEKNIIIKTYDVRDFMFIEVEDNGVGIPEEDIPRIFERFYMVDKSRAKRGTGLGLAIVKHIVKMFNGEIYVKSKVGLGTKFIIKIKKKAT